MKASEESEPAEQETGAMGKPTPPNQFLSREEIATHLAKLAKSEPPVDLSYGAMCYRVEMPPKRAEYVCPKCGARTVYAIGWISTQKGDNRTVHRSTFASVLWEIEACRRQVTQIQNIDLYLDEMQFCSMCSPDVKKPKLVLAVCYPGEKESHRTSGITADDITLIEEFLAGEKKHKGAQGHETPLVAHIARIESVLGVKTTRDR